MQNEVVEMFNDNSLIVVGWVPFVSLFIAFKKNLDKIFT